MVLLPPGPAPGDETAGAELAVEDAGLSGRDIYARVLENRFQSLIQDSTLSSADRGGRHQVTKLRMHWQDFREDGTYAEKGVLSKTLVKYFHPFDIRHSGYLIVQNDHRINDQFVYFPSRRKVVRVNLRSEAVFGTDFSFEDIMPRELQDATYQRLADTRIDGRAAYTIEAIPTEFANSEYSRFVINVEKARFVPLRTRYWDEAGVEVKELRVAPGSITRFGTVWVPLKVTMRHLQLETSTTLEITHLEPNPELPRHTFALQRLESH